MRYGNDHPAPVFLLVMFVLLSLAAPARFVYCIGYDGHQAIELAGEPCAVENDRPRNEAGCGDAAAVVFSTNPCTDIPIAASMQHAVLRQSAGLLSVPVASGALIGLADPEAGIGAGRPQWTRLGGSQSYVSRASLRSIILQV